MYWLIDIVKIIILIVYQANEKIDTIKSIPTDLGDLKSGPVCPELQVIS